jgi:hypothetical protein
VELHQSPSDFDGFDDTGYQGLEFDSDDSRECGSMWNAIVLLTAKSDENTRLEGLEAGQIPICLTIVLSDC